MNLTQSEHNVGVGDKLALNRPLVVKLGFDPTAPDLHLGHFVVLNAARKFQNAGHTVHIIVGDFTASIGDPSGRNKLRPPLSPEEIAANAKTYMDQAFLVLDPRQTKISMNKSWFDALNMSNLLKLISSVTINQIMEREDFKQRFGAHSPIYMHELLYPIMQAYDSVQIQADVELGGTDQLFNLMMGRVIQKSHGQPEQAILTMPILPGLDGVVKMSKSKNNYIGLTESAAQMFGKTMSIPDAIMWDWWKLLAEPSEEDLGSLREMHPRDAKVALAKWVVARFHGEEAAEAEADAFNQRFTQKDLSNVAVLEWPVPAPSFLVDVLMSLKVANTKSDARRKIEQKGVRINGTPVDRFDHQVLPGDAFLLEVGKKFAVKFVAV